MAGDDPLPPLRDVIRRHGLSADKRLGQNFLLDLNLTDKIARAAGPLEDFCVVEVGPGPGGLTRSLLRGGARLVVAIEQDARCVAALEEVAEVYGEALRIVAGDALDMALGGLAEGRSCIVANLPYNISTALLVRWLTEKPWPPWFEHMTLMFQREVANRIVAGPGGRDYGRLSVLAQWRCEAQRLFDIDARAFTPQPKVTSSLVRLVPRPAPSPACALRDLERVTAAAFGQRRKMLRSSLKELGPPPLALLDAAGVPADLRAEQVGIEGFCRLAACLDEIERDRG